MEKFLKFCLIISLFILLISGFFHPITAMNQDLGRHLLNGKIIVNSHSVPKINLFSYTYPNFPFINSHWFSEVLFYETHTFFGFNGLLIITVLSVLAAYCLALAATSHSGEKQSEDSRIKLKNIMSRIGFRPCQNDGKIITVATASLLYFQVLFERTDVRPEIFSFLFLSVFIFVLYKFRERFTKWIFVLPFIELLWVNIHIYFVIGIAVLGLFFIETLVLFLRHSGKQSVSRILKRSWTSQDDDVKKIRVFLLIIILCSLVTLLNPNGLAGTLYPFTVFNNYGYTIEENQNVFFLWNYFHFKTSLFFFFISSALLFFSLFITAKKSRLIDWLLALCFIYLAASAERNFPLFVFATLPALIYSLSVIFEKIFDRSRNKFGMTRIEILTYCLLLITCLFSIFKTTQAKRFGFGVAEDAKPGLDFFINNNLKGPIFNNFDIGSYIEYRLYPKEKTFVDGRPEAYSVSFFQNMYIPMQQDQKIFEKINKAYHFNTVIFAHTDQTPWAESFLKFAINDPNWKLIYLDDTIVIFMKNSGENTNFIRNYSVNQNSIRLSSFNYNSEEKIVRLLHIFLLFEWKGLQVQALQKIIEFNPQNCIALYNLANLYSTQNQNLSALYVSRFNQSCR